MSTNVCHQEGLSQNKASFKYLLVFYQKFQCLPTLLPRTIFNYNSVICLVWCALLPLFIVKGYLIEKDRMPTIKEIAWRREEKLIFYGMHLIFLNVKAHQATTEEEDNQESSKLLNDHWNNYFL